MNGISYSQRLELCNLEVLKLRRLYADLNHMVFHVLILKSVCPGLQCILSEEILQTV